IGGDGSSAWLCAFSNSLSDCANDEFTVRRKPCTLGESGFLRTPSWVLRCFIASFPGSPGCYFPLDIPSTTTYVACKHIVKMHLSLKGLHLTDETRRSIRCPKNHKSPRSPPGGKRCPFESAMLSLLAWSVPSNSCPRKRATVFRLRRLPSSSLSLLAKTALKLRP